MAEKCKILGIAGSLRAKSFNRGLLRAARELLPSHASMEIFDLSDIPGFSEDEEKNPPPIIVQFKQKIKEANALIFATPEYNYSISGVLKNAIDWASRPYGDSAWNGKAAAIVGASVGAQGTSRAQYHLRQIFVTLNVYPINKPEIIIPNATEHFDSEGNLTDEKTKKYLKQLVEALISWSNQISSK